ncbi:hypothetical protein [Leptolyngbya subtilissima]|nr:hypothetical protein [Nodosilinea sp. FACHB-13]
MGSPVPLQRSDPTNVQPECATCNEELLNYLHTTPLEIYHAEQDLYDALL